MVTKDISLKIVYSLFIICLFYSLFYKNKESMENPDCIESCEICKKCSNNTDVEKIKKEIEKMKEDILYNTGKIDNITKEIESAKQEIEDSKLKNS